MRVISIIILSFCISILYMSCAKKNTAINSQNADKTSSIQGAWVLSHLGERKVTLKSEEEAISIEIDTVTMTVSGYTGCNRMHGRISKLSGSEFILSPIAATKRMCKEAQYENDLLKSLDKIATFRIVKNTLELLDDSGTSLLRLERSHNRTQEISVG